MLGYSALAQSPSASPSSAAKPSIERPPAHTYSSPCSSIVDVCDVLAKYGSLTHLKIIRDNFVQGKVSIDDVSSLPSDKAIEIIERTLFSDGFAITQIHPDTVEAKKKEPPKQQEVPIATSAPSQPDTRGQSAVKRFYQ